jgi:hypothetical protein
VGEAIMLAAADIDPACMIEAADDLAVLVSMVGMSSTF